MPHRLERVTVKCARDGCDNTFEVGVGAKYQRKYCSLKCFHLDRNVRKRSSKHASQVRRIRRTKSVSLLTLQEMSTGSGSDGGKFAKVVGDIISGNVQLASVMDIKMSEE